MIDANTFRLDGRLALITGSSGGIGFALARGLGQAGAALVLNGRDEVKLAQAAAALRAEGLTVHERAFDVTQADAVQPAIEAIERELGPIEILVNNAGMTRRSPLQDFPHADWHQIMQTNVDSAFIVGQAVARPMIARGRGRIVNICSVQSELGRPGIAPYMASKGALKMLTKAMCVDWARHNIQANGLGPGYFRTEMTQPLVDNVEFTRWLQNRTPSGRWGEVHELAGAAVFLASSAADFVNGQMLYVDGGMSASL